MQLTVYGVDWGGGDKLPTQKPQPESFSSRGEERARKKVPTRFTKGETELTVYGCHWGHLDAGRE